VEKTAYTCPKFLGLPDLTRAVENSLPKVLEPVINFKLGWRAYRQTIEELGSYLTKSKIKIWSAYWQGVRALRRYYAYLQQGNTPLDYLGTDQSQAEQTDLVIGVVGHPYNIYDYYISLNLIPRLRKLGAKVVTSEMVPQHVVEKEAKTLPKHLFWTYERELVGTAFHWARNRQVDGIIYVLSFGCGPDSLIQVLLEHELKKIAALPVMSLVIDEHSGEAGLATRVEAFIDMLKRKKLLSGVA
jgi:predicted nucleotide-binding protein (sugar kinase/HSP70/actin superfamily)